MTYKYSRKEIVSKLKEMGLYHDRLEEYILAKSTKQKLCRQCRHPDEKGICTCGRNVADYSELTEQDRIKLINYYLDKKLVNKVWKNSRDLYNEIKTKPKSTGKRGCLLASEKKSQKGFTPQSRPKPNKIEEIEKWSMLGDIYLVDKINEIIQVINYLLEKEK